MQSDEIKNVQPLLQQHSVSRWLSVGELRTGNCLYYIDTDQQGVMISRIDWQDLKWLDEKPKSFNECHKSILITHDILLQVGFELKAPKGDVLFTGWYYKFGNDFSMRIWEEELTGTFRYSISNFNSIWIENLHQLQNLYWSLTGCELDTKGLVAAIG